MRPQLDIHVADLAKAQIRVAENWWRLNRTKAPNAIREELERAASVISVQPEAGARALNGEEAHDSALGGFVVLNLGVDVVPMRAHVCPGVCQILGSEAGVRAQEFGLA